MAKLSNIKTCLEDRADVFIAGLDMHCRTQARVRLSLATSYISDPVYQLTSEHSFTKTERVNAVPSPDFGDSRCSGVYPIFYVAPKEETYDIDRLNRFMVGLIPSENPKTVWGFHGMQGRGIKCGELIFAEEGVGIQTLVHKVTMTNPDYKCFGEIVNGERSSESTQSIDARISVRVYPSVLLAKAAYRGELRNTKEYGTGHDLSLEITGEEIRQINGLWSVFSARTKDMINKMPFV